MVVRAVECVVDAARLRGTAGREAGGGSRDGAGRVDGARSQAALGGGCRGRGYGLGERDAGKGGEENAVRHNE